MTDPTAAESARALLYRHGLPEDVIDGALCLHAQELAALQRKAHDEQRPHFHMGLPCKPEYDCGVRSVIDLIDPTQAAPAAVPVLSPPADRAALRDRIAAALRTTPSTLGAENPQLGFPSHHRPGEAGYLGWCALCVRDIDALADAVLAVLPQPADRAAGVAKRVTRAIFALKSPAPAGSEHYRSGWDDGLEAAIDAARDEVLRGLADETPAALCTECGHPCAGHREGDDPVTPGECTACPDDERHDYRPATDGEPTPLRWGLDDVMYGDDDTTTVLLSGPGGEPYWLELDPERAAALREGLAGAESQPAPTPPPA
ncbi:hypothetical protein ACFWH4_01120 [Streptomyces sp. NPDC127091]|uniref:hypothetical protein n=1 Tax=Streptomyces sp. NPDC127091 TaxID=3347134 RepID=UPI00365B7BB5